MEFKYLSENMPLGEARKVYHSLAKQLYLDIGGGEDELKILTYECSVVECRASENIVTNISDIMGAAGTMVGIVVQTLGELCPRTRVVLNYTSPTIEVEFYGNVPVKRMVTIRQIINPFGYPFSVIMLSKRDVRKTAIILFTKGNVTWINTPQGVEMDMKETPIYSGRRYTISRGGKYEQYKDKESSHLYIMRGIPKYSLQELLGTDK